MAPIIKVLKAILIHRIWIWGTDDSRSASVPTGWVVKKTSKGPIRCHGDGRQRPVAVQGEPDHDLFFGLRVRLRRVLGKAIEGHQTSVLGLQPAAPVRCCECWSPWATGTRRRGHSPPHQHHLAHLRTDVRPWASGPHEGADTRTIASARPLAALELPAATFMFVNSRPARAHDADYGTWSRIEKSTGVMPRLAGR